MPYTPHRALIAPARPSAHPLRLLCGFCLATALYLILVAFGVGFVAGFISTYTKDPNWSANIITASTPGTALLMLFSFASMIAALWLTLLLIHKRSLLGLLGPRATMLHQFLRVALFLLVLQVPFYLWPTPYGLSLIPNLQLGTWIQYLPFALLGLLIQVSAEEMVFRGYLQSQLAARFSHPIIWIGLPSVIFGLLHYDTDVAGQNAWLLVALAMAFGLVAADITARSGTLGPAIALHAVNNLSAILVVAPLGYLDGLALYAFPIDLTDLGASWFFFAADFLFILCSWLAARLAIRR